MNQFTVGLERELFKDASFCVSYINREWKNLIGVYDLQADYAPVDVYRPRAEQQPSPDLRADRGNGRHLRVRHRQHQEGRALDPARSLPEVLGRRVPVQQALLQPLAAPRFLCLLQGHGDDRQRVGRRHRLRRPRQHERPTTRISGSTTRATPTNDPTHMIKLQGTYILPFEISFNAYYPGHHRERLDDPVPDVAASTRDG